MYKRQEKDSTDTEGHDEDLATIDDTEDFENETDHMVGKGQVDKGKDEGKEEDGPHSVSYTHLRSYTNIELISLSDKPVISEISSGVIPRAVSYTHLDVYKRQSLALDRRKICPIR